MKTINKVTFFIFSCIALSHLSTHCFYNDGRPSGALTGAAIGGLAGGRKGAGIGLGVGFASDMIGSASANNRRYYDNDDYYYEQQQKNARRKHRSTKQQLADCMDENEELRQDLIDLQRQLRQQSKKQ